LTALTSAWNCCSSASREDMLAQITSRRAIDSPKAYETSSKQKIE
jgi:hypothetical protein